MTKIEQGWECPRCQIVNAPWKETCDCNPEDVVTVEDISTVTYPGYYFPNYVPSFYDYNGTSIPIDWFKTFTILGGIK